MIPVMIPIIASVKVMRSYDYCHFEVALSTQCSTMGGIDDLRKDAARLVDKAVAQYITAKEAAEVRSGGRWRTQRRCPRKTGRSARRPSSNTTATRHSWRSSSLIIRTTGNTRIAMSEITRNPLCWPNNVPRHPPHRLMMPRFELRSLDQAARMVIHEINRLNQRHWRHNDESVIISSNVRLRQDGLPYSNDKEPFDVGVAVYFKLRFDRNGKWYERPCVLSCDKWCRVGYNLTAIAKDIDAQRARDRWGATNIEQAFRGYLAIPEQCGGQAWWDMFSLPSTATKDDIISKFRQLAKSAHPDVGGNVAEWNRLSIAYEEAMALHR